MGQKVNPHGLRVGVIKDWDSRWFTTDKKEFGNLLLEDHNVRNFLKKRLYSAGVAKIEIERSANKLKLDLHVAKPGVVIGKAGAGIDALKAELEKMTKKTVIVNIVEVRNPDKDAQLVAENIALAIERRVAFRRAMKQAIQRAMKSGVKGIKVWICNGEVLPTKNGVNPREERRNDRRDNKRNDRRDNRRNNRRGNDNRGNNRGQRPQGSRPQRTENKGN